LKKCINTEKKELLTWLSARPTENCFFIGDIENFGLETDFLEIWRTPEAGPSAALLMRYYRFYQITVGNPGGGDETAEALEAAARQILLDDQCLSVAGLEPAVRELSEHLPLRDIRGTFLAELTGETFRDPGEGHPTEPAGVEDIDDLFEFQKSIVEFEMDERHRESFGNEIRTGTGRTWLIREGRRIVASATITAENSRNGMIIGVATAPDRRGRGYARTCVARLCREMVGAGKSVVLFYDNPEAGRLYKELGFKDINRWAMAKR
jgi:hypothetical protein